MTLGQFKTYRDLAAWTASYALTLHVYRVTAGFPRSEQYGLTSQMRRAASSVPSNIAEGWGRGTSTGDFVRFLTIARASLHELSTQVELARDLGYHDDDSLLKSVDRCGRILAGLIRTTRC